jgi:hypothetical protein
VDCLQVVGRSAYTLLFLSRPTGAILNPAFIALIPIAIDRRAACHVQ